MFGRVNVIKIVVAHVKTLREYDYRLQNYKKQIISTNDFLLFVIFPVTISSLLSFFSVNFGSQIDNIIKSLALMSAFMFNLLSIGFNAADKIRNSVNLSSRDKEKRLMLAEEIHVNIPFNIIIGIILIVLLVILDEVDWRKYNNVCKQVTFGVCFYFLMVFVLTLFMIISKMFVIFKIVPDNQKNELDR